MEQSKPPSTGTRSERARDTGHTVLNLAVPILSGEAETTTMGGELEYDTADPFAVTLVVDSRKGPVRWTFSRELLAEGRFDPMGDGDVQVWPCLGSDGSAVVIIELHSPSGDALLQLPSRVVGTFVAETHRLVPPGSESAHLSLDDLLARLLDA